ncbi:hypothetical protein FNJ88_10060 [Chryseobacterium sp. SNU WT5]|uniref:hypothetical protein n=1 Tax=Chryseobacterium sp. SNU WT5 TaxID=2594269 RepID=UPI001180FCDF|nr:hypothetical protein [Chryseobacterium sp. SNU WT5]QDP85871.1 hypothetical protein FNJ88_10060 [Chryseobacterium sp. SNU WT5]
MKKTLLLLSIFLLFISCSTNNIGEKESKIVQNNAKIIELILINPKENFIWKKGEFLSLEANLTNKSPIPITILKPKTSSKITTDYFTVNFTQGRKLNYEGNPEIPGSRKNDDFVTILPNQTIVLHINGDAYLTQFYSDETIKEDKIKFNLIYNEDEETHNYTRDSYFITKNFKTKLTDSEEAILKKDITALSTSPSLESMKVVDQNKYLADFEKNYKANRINTTDEELSLIIEKFNSLYVNKIESNTITIKIEK